MSDLDTRRDARLVPVHLHTRRSGELLWQDRGRAFVPEGAAAGRADTLLYEAITYAVEDVFDDGRAVTIWARAPEGQRRRGLPRH